MVLLDKAQHYLLGLVSRVAIDIFLAIFFLLVAIAFALVPVAGIVFIVSFGRSIFD